MEYFIGSAKFTWLMSLTAFIVFLIEDACAVKRSNLVILLPKIIFYQAFLCEIFRLKSKKHSLSLTPALISISLRNMMVHVIFGFFNYRKYGMIVHTCWFLIDTFKFIHVIFNNRITGFLKYFISIPLFIFHSFFECLDIIQISSSFHIAIRAFFIFVFVLYLVSLETVLKHKFLQLLWYRKSKRRVNLNLESKK